MRAAIVCLAFASLAVAQERKPKYLHESADGGYQVGLPGKPTKTTTQELTTAAGTLKVHTTLFDTRNDLVLSVTYADYPKEFVSVPAKKVLDGIRDTMKGLDGEITDEKDVTLGTDKHPGRQFRIAAGKTVIRARVYLVGTRVYQVMASGKKDAASGTVADDLFATFEVK